MGRKTTLAKDALLWSVLSLPPVWASLTVDLAEPYSRPLVITGLIVIATAVAVARARPLMAMLIAAALWAGSISVRAEPTVFFPALAAMSYVAGVRMDRVRPALLGLAGSAAAASVLVPLMRWDLGAWFFAVSGIGLFGVVPWLAGHARHQYLAISVVGWELAERFEREQRAVAEQARLRERARIAGDMHDLLGHDLSLVALRIGALEVAPDLDEPHRAAAGEARAAVTAAAERLRDIVELLRDDGGSGCGDESVAELVERARAAGMRADLDVHGDGVPLPPMIEPAVRRVAQEGLTNAAKHAPGAPVRVRLDHRPGETVVSVTNGPPADPATAPAASGGFGLTALAERVRLCGGSLRHDSCQDGGFTLVARLPHASGPSRPPGPVSPSRSAVHLAGVRGRARSSRRAAVLAALGSAAAVMAFALGGTVLEATTSVLTPGTYAQLRVGQPRAEVEALLPDRTRVDDPNWPEPPVPPGARCRYYSTHSEPFGARGLDLYRLCFAGDRLASKDFLPAPHSP